MVSNRIIKIDLNKKTKNVVQMVQGDTNRKLTINVYDSDEPYLVNGVGGETIHGAVYIEKPDGTTCGYDSLEDDSPAVTGSGNTLTVYFVPQATTAHGWAYMTVSIFDDEGVELNTFGIDLFIDKKATATISADYWNLKSIEGLTAAVEGLTQQMVRSVNHATADTNGNVSLWPWQLPYSGVIGGQQVGDVEEALDGLARMQAEIISQDIKDTLVNALSHVAWVDEHGQDYVDALEQAMRSKLVSISAVFNQGTAVIYDTDDLDTLRQYLTVTALYSDTTTRTVTAYTLSGSLTEGTSIITVDYGGKTTTFTVIVTENPVPLIYQRVEYVENQSKAYASTGLYFPVSFRAELKTKLNGWGGSDITYGLVTGTRNASDSSSFGIYTSYTKNSEVRCYAGVSSTISLSSMEDVLEWGFECDGSESNVFIVSDGETVYGTAGDVSRNYRATPIGIFQAAYTGMPSAIETGFVGRIYKYTIYNSDNSVFADFVPVYRKSDNKVGFFETVSRTFITNKGSDTFVKGGDVR